MNEHSRRQADAVPDIREIEALSRRVQHIDSSNAELSARMSGIESSVNSLVTAVDRIMDKVSAPPQSTNWQAILAAMSLVFALAASYSNLSITPLRETLALHTNDIKEVSALLSTTAAEAHSAQERLNTLSRRAEKLDTTVLSNAQRLTSLETTLAIRPSPK